MDEINFEWSLFTQLGVTYDEVPYRNVTLEDNSGVQYRGLKFNLTTKTLCYEMKLSPTERWAGPFHGRLMRDFIQMKTIQGKIND